MLSPSVKRGTVFSATNLNAAVLLSGRRLFLLGAVLHLCALFLAAPPCSATQNTGRGDGIAPSPRRVCIDFEDHSTSGWLPRAGDEPYVTDIAMAEGRLPGTQALRIGFSGYRVDPVHANEVVVVAKMLERPVHVDSTTGISWCWKVQDRNRNDGVDLVFLVDHEDGSEAHAIWFMSHSLRQRGAWPFDDPEQRWIRHTISFAHLPPLSNKPPRLPCRIVGFLVCAAFPKDQAVWVDDIRVAPAAELPAGTDVSEYVHSLSPAATSLAVLDADGDPFPDYLVGLSGARPRLLCGTGEGRPQPVPLYLSGLPANASFWGARIHDLDRDGRLDVVTIGAGGLEILQGRGRGEFVWISSVAPADLGPDAIPRTATDRNEGPALPTDVIVGDLLPDEDDGRDRAGARDELLLLRSVSPVFDSLYVWRQERWTGRPMLPPCLGPAIGGESPFWRYRTGGSLADIDGDLDLDLFLSNCDLYLREPDGLHCASDRLPEYGRNQGRGVFGDVDSDGDMDLFIPVDVRLATSAPDITHDHSLLWRNDGGTFTDVSSRIHGAPTNRISEGMFEDADLDGDLDLFLVQADWLPGPRPANLLFRNDGHGSFELCREDPAWIVSAPAATDAVLCDADADGDPDLVLIDADDEREVVVTNPGSGGRSIRVRVLSRAGAPDGSGAYVVLRTEHPPGRSVQMRQTGVAPLHPGLAVALFGCPEPGPYELALVFPSAPRDTIRRHGLRPGQSVEIHEPLWAGAGGRIAAEIQAWRRRSAGSLAMAGWKLIPPVAILIGIPAGAAAEALRRRARAARQAGPDVRKQCAPSGRGPRGVRGPSGPGAMSKTRHAPLDLCYTALLAAEQSPVFLCTTLAVAAAGFLWLAPVWPPHRAGRAGAIMAGLAFGSGVLSGGSMAFLDARRRASSSPAAADPVRSRAQLIDAASGFSHAGWMQASLLPASVLCDAVVQGMRSPGEIRPSLEKSLRPYPLAVRPQLVRIRMWMEPAEVSPRLTAHFERALTFLDAGVAHLMPSPGRDGEDAGHDTCTPDIRRTMRRFRRAVLMLQSVMRRLYQEIGRTHRTTIEPVVAAVIERARHENPEVTYFTRIAPRVRPVFGEASQLANILENLLSNAARALARAPGGGQPAIVVEARELGDFVLLSVSDSGPGIPPETIDSLFTLRDVAEGARGTGLPAAAHTLRSWDGRIDVSRSDAADGTEITVTLRVL